MIQALLLAGSCLAALIVLLVFAPVSEQQPKHAASGAGALTVARLRAQLWADGAARPVREPDEPIVWPTVDPDDPRPSLDTLQRVLDGLRRL